MQIRPSAERKRTQRSRLPFLGVVAIGTEKSRTVGLFAGSGARQVLARNQVPRKISQSNSPLKKRIAAETNHATTVVKREFTNAPILARSLVNCTRGITANGNWKLKTT